MWDPSLGLVQRLPALPHVRPPPDPRNPLRNHTVLSSLRAYECSPVLASCPFLLPRETDGQLDGQSDTGVQSSEWGGKCRAGEALARDRPGMRINRLREGPWPGKGLPLGQGWERAVGVTLERNGMDLLSRNGSSFSVIDCGV